MDWIAESTREMRVNSPDAAILANWVGKHTNKQPVGAAEWAAMTDKERLEHVRRDVGPSEQVASESRKRPRGEEEERAVRVARVDSLDEAMQTVLPRRAALDILSRVSIPWRYNNVRAALERGNEDLAFSLYLSHVAYNMYKRLGERALAEADIESDLYARLVVA